MSGPPRDASFGQDGALTLVDRLGVWLSGHQIRKHVPSFDGLVVADIGCGYEATFARRVLPRARRAVGMLEDRQSAGAQVGDQVPAERSRQQRRVRRPVVLGRVDDGGDEVQETEA